MAPLSARAADILDRMEPNLGYQASELRPFAPELSPEALRDVMRELWIARQVERFGYSGWRRVLTARPVQEASGVVPTAGVQTVKPEDLFDHDAFTGLFK